MAELGYPTSISDMERRMDRMTADPEAHTFVASLSGEVIGMIGVKRLYNYETDDFLTYISCLVVKQKCRGQGFGKKLLHFIEEWSVREGMNVLYLTSGIKEERKPAHELYKQMGFEITGYRFIKKLEAKQQQEA
ncbi:GNAT family N-acetyltransferase [Cohnella faecalis]|uniref:GNAT family N-acetyltransferase n=2 Tax=Cohnella faecalis TaxID=2315694 RepID=A0A398CLH6_9BACL|nr:GNAT family N-acetyltransferase [Cohnella faecalis]